MRPLLAKELKNFLQRFNHFKDGELRSIEIISPSVIQITLAAQDNARAFDWVSVILEFNNVLDAKLIDASKLAFISMEEGISIVYEENCFAFGTGKSNSIQNIKNSTCHVLSESLKFQEGAF